MRVATAQDVLMPRPLRQGDRVAIVSPSSTPDSLVVEKGAEVLRQWGYEPVVGKHALNKYHGFAGTVEERLEDFLWALRDTTICAILCSRGGDGAVQLLPYISLEEFRSNPKWFLGFSDATALHSAWVSAGVMSLHSTMCEGIASRQENDSSLLALRGVLEGKMPSYQVPHHPLDQSGVGEGLLVGGNLSVLCGVAGRWIACSTNWMCAAYSLVSRALSLGISQNTKRPRTILTICTICCITICNTSLFPFATTSPRDIIAVQTYPWWKAVVSV